MTLILDADEIIGAVKQQEWSLYAATPFEWMIGTSDSDRGQHILRQRQDGAVELDGSTTIRTISADDVRDLFDSNTLLSDLPWLYLVVDIERQLYVNGFFDLALEHSVPKGWRGIHADPYEFVPSSIASWWKDYPTWKRIEEPNSITQRIGSFLNSLMTRWSGRK